MKRLITTAAMALALVFPGLARAPIATTPAGFLLSAIIAPLSNVRGHTVSRAEEQHPVLERGRPPGS